MSFMATQRIGFGARRSSAANPSMAFVVGSNVTAAGSTHTYSAVSFGVAAADRKIIVAMGWGSNVTLSSATIGGISATIVKQDTNANQASSAIIIADVPSGTTGDVVLTFSGSSGRSAIGVYRVVSLTSSTAHATAGDITQVSGVLSTTCNVPANGFIVSCVCTPDGSAWTWTDPTEDYDIHVAASNAISTASASYVAAQTPLTVSTTDGTGGRGSMSVASWGN